MNNGEFDENFFEDFVRDLRWLFDENLFKNLDFKEKRVIKYY